MIGIPRQVASGVPEGKGMVAVALGERRVLSGAGVRVAVPVAGGVSKAGSVAARVPAGAEAVAPCGGLEAERVQAGRRVRAMTARGRRRRSVMESVGAMGEPPHLRLAGLLQA
jgi:hypothetical protein